MKILYVEDEPILRDEIALILEMEGYTVITADDGECAWQAYLADQPDLIITDIKMPRLSGIEFLQRAEAHCLVAPPAIITSAYAEQDMPQIDSSLKITHYLTKPFSLLGLLDILREFDAVQSD